MATPSRETIYLEHWMRGRARLRVPRPRTPAHVRRLAGRIGRSKSVRSVNANPDTGSVLVTFDDDDPIDLIVDELRIAGLEILSAMPAPRTGVRTESASAATVRRVLSQANALLHVKTRGRVDLRLAVPAVYLLLASRAFLRQGGRLRTAEWYQLLYWAFDSFHKLHEQASTVEEGAHGRLEG